MKKMLSALLVLLLLLLGIVACGCGGGDKGGEDAAPGDGSGEEEDSGTDEALLNLDNWEVPTKLNEMIALFSEVNYRFTVGGVETVVHYRYLGSENVGGAATDKISLSMDEQTFTFWVGADGSIKQMEQGGQVIPAEIAQSAGMGVANMVLVPLVMAEGVKIQDWVRVTEPGYKVTVLSSKNEKIGDLSGMVHTLQVVVEPPLVPTEVTYVARVADLGDFQTMLSWEVTGGEGGTYDFKYEIEALALR
ncbi:MAG: hypothetical protein AB1767_13310 [Bacillota bacterium]